MAKRVGRTDPRARAHYHEGVARELATDRVGALHAYVRAANLSPNGDWTSDALLAACRVQWLLGRRNDAQRTFDILRARREWSAHAAEAAVFLAVSQLAAGEVGSAPLLLQQAVQLRGANDSETTYWIGRADEAQGETGAALLRYLRLRARSPTTRSPRNAARLAGPAMAPAVKAAVERCGARRAPRTASPPGCCSPPATPARALRLYLYQQWAREPPCWPFLRLAPVERRSAAVAIPLADAEERVLALAAGATSASRPSRATSRSASRRSPSPRAAAARGAHPGRALALAQEAAAPALAAAPPQLLPLPLRDVLFPRPWPQRVQAAARRQAVEPALLWAVMREGSRFDTAAMTPGRRGRNALLDPASAERAAPAAGMRHVRPDDLYEPEMAIAVGAARLSQLGAAFPGRPALALAAHLVGAPQARLWASWCTTSDPAEALAKIGNAEVRTTVARVLGAQIAYDELPATAGRP